MIKFSENLTLIIRPKNRKVLKAEIYEEITGDVVEEGEIEISTGPEKVTEFINSFAKKLEEKTL